MSTAESRWPLRRIVLVPAVLFLAVSALVFTLAKLHLAKPTVASAGPIALGDPYRGQVVFTQTCAACHGAQAQGKVGPRLAGASISLAEAKAQIDNGGGIMPARLVTGGREADLLAYLATILES